MSIVFGEDISKSRSSLRCGAERGALGGERTPGGAVRGCIGRADMIKSYVEKLFRKERCNDVP